MKCAVWRCMEEAKREGMCVVHALTWLLTPDSRPGPERDERLRSFISRQDTRHALRGQSA